MKLLLSGRPYILLIMTAVASDISRPKLAQIVSSQNIIIAQKFLFILQQLQLSSFLIFIENLPILDLAGKYIVHLFRRETS